MWRDNRTRGDVQPSILHAGSSLEMASCAFSHIPCSKIFPYPFLFISALIFKISLRNLLRNYFFSHGHFCLLAWLVNCVLLFLTADLGSFLVLLYHLWMPFTGASSAFGFGLSVTTLNHLVLVFLKIYT